MTPESLLGNATSLGLVIAPLAGILSAVVGTCAYIAGKAGNSPGLCSWGKGGWLGGVIGAATTGIVALVANVGGRL